MSETVEPRSRGSYDDVPDEHVATVLNVPLRLSQTPAPSPTQTPSGLGGRHRKPGPPVDAPENIPEELPAQNLAPTPHDSHPHWNATLKVGAISAAIVFGAATLVLVALTWLP